MKAVGKIPDDVVQHQAILAYASDMGLLSTSMNPHRLSFAKGNVMSASLDHAMWFHRPFRADEWMLYSTLLIAQVQAMQEASIEVVFTRKTEFWLLQLYKKV